MGTHKPWMQVVAVGIVVGSIFFSVFVAHGIKLFAGGYGQEPSMRQRLAQIPTNIMGPRIENIYLSKTAFPRESSEAWQRLLKELSGFIEKHKAANLSTANKELFKTTLENLDDWANELFNAVKIMKNTVIKDSVRNGGDEKAITKIIAPLERLLQTIAAFQQKLKPKTTGGRLLKDAPETVTIKKLLYDFCLALTVMIEKASNDGKKLKTILADTYKEHLRENPISKKP